MKFKKLKNANRREILESRNNAFMIALAFICALVSWYYVKMKYHETDIKNFTDVAVVADISGTTAEENGLQIINTLKNVNVRFECSSKDYSRVTKNRIIAYVDMKNYSRADEYDIKVQLKSGIAPGIPVDEEFIAYQMKLRQSVGALSTARREADSVKIVSGLFNGRTTGTPMTFIIENQDTRSKDYGELAYKARPGHADFSAQIKYHGFQDYRGGGHFSGRITAGIVAAGAVAIGALRRKGIKIGTHILSCGGVFDRTFDDLNTDIDRLNSMEFAVLDDKKAEEMQAAITAAKQDSDSVGGRLETVVTGVPAGVGEPWFDTLESILAHALFSIPAIKGVEFGAGFAAADMLGSQCNDCFRIENNNVTAPTNNNGGVIGGITTGMPILFRTAVKPTPSIFKEQNTIDLKSFDNTTLQIKGRHDPAIVHRARVVVDSVTALVLCDQLAMRFGTDWLKSD